MSEWALLPAAWIATYLLHSTVLYGIVRAIERARLLRAPAAREHLWRAALLGALLTATAQGAGVAGRIPLRTRVNLPGRMADRSVSSSTFGVAPAPVGNQRPPIPVVVATPSRSTTEAAGAVASRRDNGAGAVAPFRNRRATLTRLGVALGSRWALLLSLIWIAGAAVAGLRLVASGWLTRRQLAGRAEAGPTFAAEFADLCSKRGVRQPPLTVAPLVAGPISLPSGEIVVPPWAVASLDARHRRAMLAHELAHQVRRDPLWGVLARAINALLWIQPLNGLACRRLRHLAEIQADAWAARAVKDPRALAECLAECVEHLDDHRAAIFGVALTSESLLVERVDRLLKGDPMHAFRASRPLQIGVMAVLVAATFVLPGCDLEGRHVFGHRASTSIWSSRNGDFEVTIDRPRYSLHMESNGRISFTEDESDLASPAPGARFVLKETRDGVTCEYTARSDRSGALACTWSRDGENLPMDESAARWLAGALPRMFRESGLDAEARIARLLARGGPDLVLAEIDSTVTDYAKASYLGKLFDAARLDTTQTARALGSAARIQSDYELRRVLSRILKSETMDAPRTALLLRTGQQLGSDYERAELLTEAAEAPAPACLVSGASARRGPCPRSG